MGMRCITFVCFLNLAICVQFAVAGEAARSYSHSFADTTPVSDEIPTEKAVTISGDKST